MYGIGIDVGSTYTKYCVMDESQGIVGLSSERTPVRQKEYFTDRIAQLQERYPSADVVTCGYGRNNIASRQRMSELTALAKGASYITGRDGVVLDIGGQDTKLIRTGNGRPKEFFVNEKCAAGCGAFLAGTLNTLQLKYADIDLSGVTQPRLYLSSVCAVFAQTEIVKLLAEDRETQAILEAVIWHILGQAKHLLTKVDCQEVLFSGGIACIRGIRPFAESSWERTVEITRDAEYYSAIGCALTAVKQ